MIPMKKQEAKLEVSSFAGATREQLWGNVAKATYAVTMLQKLVMPLDSYFTFLINPNFEELSNFFRWTLRWNLSLEHKSVRN